MANAAYRGVDGAFVFYDNDSLLGSLGYHSWLDAVGSDVIKLIVGPGMVNATSGDIWTITNLSGSTAVSTAVGQSLLMTPTATEYQGTQIQGVNTAFKLVSGDKLYFGATVTLADATNGDMLVGLASTDTTLFATSSSHAVSLTGDGLFFVKLDATTDITFEGYLDNTKENTASAGTATTSEVDFEIFYDGAKVFAFVNQALKTTFTADLPDSVLTPSLAILTGASGAAADTLTVKSVRCIQIQ